MEPNNDLDQIVLQAPTPTKGKTTLADTVGNVTYSLIAASALDCVVGLNLAGIVTARASSIPLNAITGRPYGWWREQSYRLTGTTESSGKLRKTATDLLAFNTFQVPLYSALVAFGSLVSEGKIDWEKVRHGAAYLATISPFIGPTMGIYMDFIRKCFGVKSAAKTAETNTTADYTGAPHA